MATADQELMFKLAASFDFSSQILSSHSQHRFKTIFPGIAQARADLSLVPGFVPAIVLSTFSLELYLKCLLWITVGNPPKNTHLLDKIFGKLPVSTQNEIKESYAFHAPATPSNHALAPVDFDGTPIDFSFDSVLATNSNVFKTWRYAYENHGLMRCYGMPYLLQAVKIAILKVQPTWQALLDACGKLPTPTE
jgi:hypothetical protein